MSQKEFLVTFCLSCAFQNVPFLKSIMYFQYQSLEMVLTSFWNQDSTKSQKNNFYTFPFTLKGIHPNKLINIIQVQTEIDMIQIT